MPSVWPVLAKALELRNLGEYEGQLEVGERLVADLLDTARLVALKVQSLEPIEPDVS